MYYFVNEYFYGLNSGIEHAEMKRLNLFKSMNVPAKLVTREFNTQLHRNMAKFGLHSDDVVNMFDFFQGATNIETKQAKIKDAKVNPDYEISPDSTVSKVFRVNLLNNRVIFMAGTFGQLDTKESFDKYQNFVQAEQWDWRGFKSCIKYYDDESHLIRDEYLDIHGNTVLEAAYGGEGVSQSDMTFIRLINYKGHDRFFGNIDELFTFFLAELDKVQTPGENTFIADRPLPTYKPVMSIPSQSRKFIFMPMIQTNQKYSLSDGALADIYQDALSRENIGLLNGIIVATKAQQKDMADHIQKKIGVDTPVIYLPAATTDGVVPVAGGKKDQIIFVGRLGNDKGIVRLIQMFKEVHNHLTNLKLEIYGYGEAKKPAQEEAKKLGIDDVVDFNDYQIDLSKPYSEAQLFVTPTPVDIEPLALTEAASYGLPMVAFNIAYGPSEIIRDGWNGMLFRDGETKEMAEGIAVLLKDPKRLAEYSENARKTAEKFSNKAIAKLWQSQIVNN
ncbi:poly(glycerol-phosphate) alpha-glucosyltransferase [Lentilactobacillus fungorum]|uniref:Poly(Glycerol-phosphate) alpha-glucosyltransferase n=1 Tax=Lentilactobacillus fungorum TaxID=2201250 RepID=A0ABQ3W2Q9_9LACO|nr:glycosyltransferase [Lentilactobacillus fungorum]GHP15090.1 poly(glycerol-phosphate) alpha-glucosyltransferase [Lentilactobacillus fungorum]